MPTANEPLPVENVVSDEVLEQAKLLREQMYKKLEELNRQLSTPVEATPQG